MTPEQGMSLLHALGLTSFGAVVASVIIGALLKWTMPAYLAEKGKNLATKEDIGSITRTVESIRAEYGKSLQEIAHQNSLLIEELRSTSQRRLAAVELRLRAHQEAFIQWRNLIANVHEPSCRETVMECAKWWEHNCLFLSAHAREALSSAYWAASMHPDFLQDKSNKDLIMENWARLMDAGKIIVEGADLPALGNREFETPGAQAPGPIPPESKSERPLA